MRYLTATIALLMGTMPGTLMAQSGDATGAYIGLEGGYAFGSDLELATDATRDDPGKIFIKDGYEIGAVAGYDFGSFRIEAEFAHRDMGVDGSQAPQGDPFAPGTVFTGHGSLKHDRLMLNAYGEFGPDTGVQGFVGAGIGTAWSDLYVVNDPYTDPIFDDGDSNLAWQLMAGARIPVGEAVEATVKYRYLQVEGAEFTDFFGRDSDGDHGTSTVTLGLAYRF